MPRGRLIYRIQVGFKPLDTASQTQDKHFKRPEEREEGTVVEIEAQPDSGFFEQLGLWAAGQIADSRMILTVHSKYLERNDLIDATTGMPLTPKKGDRLDYIRKKKNGDKIIVQNPPGLFVTMVEPVGWMGGRQNLWDVSLQSKRMAA